MVISKPRPRLSVCLIALNCRTLLERCIGSVYTYIEDVDFEVIVIDNASQDGTARMVEVKYPQARLIKNRRNLGVAPSRNQAMREAQGEYLLLLDADAELLAPGFRLLLDYLDNHRRVGLLGCSLVSAEGKLHSSARSFPRPVHVLIRRLAMMGLVKNSRLLVSHHLEDWDRREPREVDFAEGAFQIIRRKAFEEVGLLDNRMFYGFEDADYCARMIKHGFQVVCYPAYRACHHLQGITRRNPFSKWAVHHTMSYFRFYFKHRQLIQQRGKTKPD